jgi:hypothetical protein
MGIVILQQERESNDTPRQQSLAHAAVYKGAGQEVMGPARAMSAILYL